MLWPIRTIPVRASNALCAPPCRPHGSASGTGTCSRSGCAAAVPWMTIGRIRMTGAISGRRNPPIARCASISAGDLAHDAAGGAKPPPASTSRSSARRSPNWSRATSSPCHRRAMTRWPRACTGAPSTSRVCASMAHHATAICASKPAAPQRADAGGMIRWPGPSGATTPTLAKDESSIHWNRRGRTTAWGIVRNPSPASRRCSSSPSTRRIVCAAPWPVARWT